MVSFELALYKNILKFDHAVVAEVPGGDKLQLY